MIRGENGKGCRKQQQIRGLGVRPYVPKGKEENKVTINKKIKAKVAVR